MAETGFTFVPSLRGVLKSSKDGRVVQIAWSPAGTSLAAALDTGQILIWRREGERFALSAQSDLLDAGKTKPRCLAWSRAGTLLASGWSDGRLRLYHNDPFKLVRQSVGPSGGPVLSIAVHPFSSMACTACEGASELRLWSLARKTLEPVHQVPGSQEGIWGVAWHPGGKHLASCGADATVRVWAYEEKPFTFTEINHLVSQARQVVWSPDPNLLIALIEPEGRVKLWRTLQKGTRTLDHPSEVSSAVFSPDGSVCITKSSDGNVPIWGSPSGELLC